MKKYLNFAFLSAIALAGIFGFTACSSSDDLAAETNPNYDPNTKEVATQFVFNVSNGSDASTRMSADATQASSSLAAAKFRGITDSYIMCVKNAAGDGKTGRSGMIPRLPFPPIFPAFPWGKDWERKKKRKI